MNVPDSIVSAINTMLAPYGEHYEPQQPDTTSASKYVTPKEAAAHLGCSRSFLYKLSLAGEVHPIKLRKDVANGKVLYDVADLEAYIQRHRA
jgi:hypothetical protein